MERTDGILISLEMACFSWYTDVTKEKNNGKLLVWTFREPIKQFRTILSFEISASPIVLISNFIPCGTHFNANTLMALSTKH